MSTIKEQFGAATAITTTLASLASGSAQQSTAVDNTSNLFVDALLYLEIKLTGAVSGSQAVLVYFAASADGTNYSDGATGSDGSFSPAPSATTTGLFGPYVIPAVSSGETLKAIIPSVAKFFGGVLPPKWAIVIDNETGSAFDSTENNHTKQYVGVYYTVA